MNEDIDIEKYGNIRHVETTFKPQEDFIKSTPKKITKPLSATLLELERSLPDIDIGKYKEFKFVNAGENYSKNPLVIMEKVVNILEKYKSGIKSGEVKDSKNLLLQLFALFSNYYPEYTKSEPTD